MDMNWGSIIVNPWVGFLGTLFGIFGLLASVVIYLRTRRFQQPTYQKRSIKWLDVESFPHNEIKLTFRGKEIPRFTITHLAFWNSGNQTIRSSDFATTSPLCLRIPPTTEVFSIQVSACTAPEIRADIDSPSSFITDAIRDIPVGFDYLDAGDGFSIQVIHDSRSDSEFKFVGKLPGVSKFMTVTSLFDRTLESATTISKYFHMQNSQLLFGISKLFFIPLTIFIGLIGMASLYSAIFVEFHWYLILVGILVVYLAIPFVIISEPTIPKKLELAQSDNREMIG